jgi:hypothetical protein
VEAGLALRVFARRIDRVKNAWLFLVPVLAACNPLAENAKASAACVDAGPGAGATDIPCTKCCQANGGIGRHSDSTRCVCIGK